MESRSQANLVKKCEKEFRDMISSKSIRQSLSQFSHDRKAIHQTKAKSSKSSRSGNKGQMSRDVERIIDNLKNDEKKALQVFMQAGESEDQGLYL